MVTDNSNVANLGTGKNFASEREQNLLVSVNMFQDRTFNKTDNIVYNPPMRSRTPNNAGIP
jgi:hypothetical protein